MPSPIDYRPLSKDCANLESNTLSTCLSLSPIRTRIKSPSRFAASGNNLTLLSVATTLAK